MREVVAHHIMSGEEVVPDRPAEACYFTDEETAACVEEAHSHGIRVCAHACTRDSAKMCVKHGVDVIYHASWTHAEGMDMLEKNKSRLMVARAIGAVHSALYHGAPFGITYEIAEKLGYKRELDAALTVLREMHWRGIAVLPYVSPSTLIPYITSTRTSLMHDPFRGGDYGFAFTPHGTYARDIELFVTLLGFTPMESILAATAGVARLFMREDELGKTKEGYFADCMLVDGDSLQDIAVLQDHGKLDVTVINGRVHKGFKEFGGEEGL